MNSLTATLEYWAAWAPGIETPSAWSQWAQGKLAIQNEGSPDVSFLSPMLRRRLSRLSKMCLRVAHESLPKPGVAVRTIFCSRHGELERTTELLNAIVAGELLSPTAFSMSVHNTASGLYAIANHDKSPSSAVASGIDTLESAFLDAAAFLHMHDASKVMLVIADDTLPKPFTDLAETVSPPHAVAFLLSNRKHATRLSLGFTVDNKAKESSEPHALAVLRFLAGKDRQLTLKGDRLTWTWSIHG